MNCGSLFSANGGANRYCKACKGNSREKRAWYGAQKSAPCTDCGGTWPEYVMQFDHLPGCVKVGTIARMVSGAAPLCVLQAECAKCELVCANCHIVRTRTRGRFVATSLRLVGPREPSKREAKLSHRGLVGWDECAK